MEHPSPRHAPHAAPAPTGWHLVLAGLPSEDTRRLQTLLRGYGHRVSLAHGLAQVCAHLASAEVDVLLMGETEAQAIRDTAERSSPGRSAPARLCVIDQDDAGARIRALDAGDDDCLSRPYAPRELLARVDAVLRRRHVRAAMTPASAAPQETGRTITFGDWRYDSGQRRLHVPGGPAVELSPAESRLLLTFLDHPRAVLSRDALMSVARGQGFEAYERSIDLLVSRLRQKLRDDARQPRCIRTVRGVGYLFDLL
jgi:two-component system OmpR family response regulator